MFPYREGNIIYKICRFPEVSRNHGGHRWYPLNTSSHFGLGFSICVNHPSSWGPWGVREVPWRCGSSSWTPPRRRKFQRFGNRSVLWSLHKGWEKVERTDEILPEMLGKGGNNGQLMKNCWYSLKELETMMGSDGKRWEAQ